jgi:hypothetical protein
VNRTWVYIVTGAALVIGAAVVLGACGGGPDGVKDPISEAQNMLDRAQTKLSEIEARLHSSQDYAPEPA